MRQQLFVLFLFYLVRVARGVERRRIAALCVAGCLAAMVGTVAGPAAVADHGTVDRHAAKRMESMHEQGVAMQSLAHMISGRVPYDRRRARQLQKVLERESRRTDDLFKRERHDPHSRARPDLWQNWDSFEHLASNATRAAKQLDPRNRRRLMQSLPPLLAACHNCHARFRAPD